MVVEYCGRITGYAAMVEFFGHAVGETNEDLKSLVGAAAAFPGPGFCCQRATAISCGGAWGTDCESFNR
jgi:hypothetical protein